MEFQNPHCADKVYSMLLVVVISGWQPRSGYFRLMTALHSHNRGNTAVHLLGILYADMKARF